MQSKIVILSAFIVLAVVNWSIFQKERHLSEGKIVYLELAPVDPRSLMQGDYMALNFKIAEDVGAVLLPAEDFNSETSLFNLNGGMRNTDGRIVVLLDEHSRASFVRLEDNVPPGENELYMRYRVRNGKIKFATNAFFFKEGDAEYYENARYGKFRVDSDGELLLTDMFDTDLKLLGPLDGNVEK